MDSIVLYLAMMNALITNSYGSSPKSMVTEETGALLLSAKIRSKFPYCERNGNDPSLLIFFVY